MLFPRNSRRDSGPTSQEKGMMIKGSLSSSRRTSMTSSESSADPSLMQDSISQFSTMSEMTDASSGRKEQKRLDKLRKDQRRARKEMTKKAEAGNTHYMFLVGWYYLSGSEGFELDETMAFHWTQRAHLAGDVQGTAVLGSMYLVGAGTDPDMRMAVECLKAASKECDLAAFHLGRIYLKGFPKYGIEANRPQAYRLLQLAASETCTHQILGPKLTEEAKQLVRKLNGKQQTLGRRRL